jgi:hypothetical protein
MAQPITWRNVAAPDATAAIKGMAYANETLNSAFTKAGATVGVMTGRVAQDHADAKDTNTRSIMQALQGITTMDKYNEAVAKGDFNPEVLQQRFGKDLDFDAVGKAVLQRDNDIMTQEKQTYDYTRQKEDQAAEGFIAQFDSDLLKTPITPETQAAFDERIKAWEGPDRLKTAMYARLEDQRTGDKAEGQADEQYGWRKQEHANATEAYNYDLNQRKLADKLIGAYNSAITQSADAVTATDKLGETFLTESAKTDTMIPLLFEGTDGSGKLLPTDIGKLSANRILELTGTSFDDSFVNAYAAENKLTPAVARAQIAEQAKPQLQQQLLAKQKDITQTYQQRVNEARDSGALPKEGSVADVFKSLTAGQPLNEKTFALSQDLQSKFDEQANAVQTSLPVSAQRDYESWFNTEQGKVKAQATAKKQELELKKADLIARQVVVPEEEFKAQQAAKDELEARVSNWATPDMSWGQFFDMPINKMKDVVGGREALGWMFDWAKGDAARANNGGKPYDGWVLLKAFDAATQGQDNATGHYNKHVDLKELEKQMGIYQKKWQESEDNRKILIELEQGVTNDIADSESDLLRAAQRKKSQLKKQYTPR